VVDTVGVVVKFTDAWVSLVGGGVLSKSTTGLTHLPALCTDPGATGGGGHSWGTGRGGGNLDESLRE